MHKYGQLPRPKAPLLTEGKPFEPENSDHRQNLGSYEVTAGHGIVQLAHSLLCQAKPGEVPTMAQINGLARRLMWAADVVQATYRFDGHVERKAGSHRGARGVVRTAVEAYPLPVPAKGKKTVPEEVRDQWLEQVVTRAIDLFGLGLQLAELRFSDTPMEEADGVEGPEEHPETPSAAAEPVREPVEALVGTG